MSNEEISEKKKNVHNCIHSLEATINRLSFWWMLNWHNNGVLFDFFLIVLFKPPLLIFVVGIAWFHFQFGTILCHLHTFLRYCMI
ncbi:unnamed protein product [Haemonchus placei]|uniref:Uncharacterized protein n=1 Tax=Haemonchus placei TaxID=6290 RepID=A0A0N4WPN1_HAEPC|nr:unnamed protein product [Haemonchus placei]